MTDLKTDFSIFSDRGSRPVNEDFADSAVKRDAQCFVLCDGLGGHGMGDRASRFVARFVLHEFTRSQSLASFAQTVLPRAHQALRAEQEKAGAAGKMKTTAVVLVLEGESGFCLHIGDSRLYRFRGGAVDVQTRDHSVPQMLVLTGEIKTEEIRSHPDRNKLLRALGDERETVKFELTRFDVRAGDAFLICSDGFWEPVTESEMLALLQSEPTARAWLEKMSRLAAENSGGKAMDNYTAVAVRVRG